MKNKIYIGIWLLCMVVLDQVLGLTMSKLAPLQKQDTRIQKIINHEINSDIIILGSSRALNNYSPQALQKGTGKTCYNLGFSGSNVIFHEEILKLVLSKSKKPELIVYNIDDAGTLFTNEGISFRFDILYPFVENNDVNSIVCEQNKKALWATYLCRTYRHNVNFVNAVRYLLNGKEDLDIMVSNIDSMGANLIPVGASKAKASFLKTRILPEAQDLNMDYINSFVNIQKICAANNIKLVVCFPPLLMKPMQGFENRIKKLLLPSTYSFSFSSRFTQNPELFLNPDHLNCDGAFVFSDSLSVQLIPILK
jgi:hypothetical protein